MKNKIPAFITAVNRSEVFSDRSLQLLGSKTILEHIVIRLKKTKSISKIVLCTSDEKADDSLCAHAKDLGLGVIRGEYSNTLSRLLKAYNLVRAESAFIVRGDTPFIDPKYFDLFFEKHLENEADFSYSDHMLGLPYGTGTVIANRSVIEKIASIQKDGNCTQNIANFIRMHETRFRAYKFQYKYANPDLRFVIEHQRDLDFAKELIALSGENAGVRKLLGVIKKHPFLRQINRPQLEVQEIGIDKLILFPEKNRSILHDDVDLSYPVSVELSLTNFCNLNCSWCSDKMLRQRHSGMLDFKIVERLICEFSENGTKGIVFEGGGEPVIYPKFRDALGLAIKRRLAVGVITNGVVLNYADLLPDIEWIRVSLDADTPETYKKWKGKDCFNTVLQNIKKMCERKAECIIGVGYVVTKYNIEHLEDITMILSDYGVNYLYLRPVIDHPELRIEKDLLYLKKFETDNFSVMIHAMSENSIRGNAGLPCKSHSLSCVISADGDIFLCGRLNIYDWIKPIGNLNKQSFHKIWNGKNRVEQAKTVRNPEFCLKWCPECRLTKYNVIIEKARRIKTRNFI